jgi:hypothetical protein
MDWPTFHISISGSVLAGYAALVSTLTGAVQLRNHYLDRARINVSARPNMRIYGDPRYQGKDLIIVQVANLGRRPVTITSVGGHLKEPKNRGFVLNDCNPQLPHELTEGKSLTAVVDASQTDFSNVHWWYATDATKHTHNSKDANWLSRRLAYRKWTKAAKRKSKVTE